MERDEDPRPGYGQPDPMGPLGDPAPVSGDATRRRRGLADEPADEGERGGDFRDPWAVRAEDTEPYVGLQYVARLFKIVAMVVIVALTAEIVAAFATEGTRAFLPLFVEVIQGGVLAAILWGASDLTLLFIDVGHDVRAARVLLGRMSARMEPVGRGPEDRGVRKRVES
ncbi:MAG TPA: hypothetical protein VFQ39_07830 [Longimicrobium sp.]|nr:hypothetical protein [Longimicrobium sp.]